MCGGLIEREAYSKFWVRGEGLIREEGLIERGLNGAFTVMLPMGSVPFLDQLLQ